MSRQPDSSSEEQGATAKGLLTFTVPGASRDFFESENFGQNGFFGFMKDAGIFLGIVLFIYQLKSTIT